MVVPVLDSGVKENLFTYKYDEEEVYFTIWPNNDGKENEYYDIESYTLSFPVIDSEMKIKLNKDVCDLFVIKEIDIVNDYYNRTDAVENFGDLLDGMFEEISKLLYR